jgi:hypothetical protein
MCSEISPLSYKEAWFHLRVDSSCWRHTGWGGHTLITYPPCSVDTNRMLSPFAILYFSSPSSSQSTSLIRTKIPGRLKSVSSTTYLQLSTSLHRAAKDKEFSSLVVHDHVAKVSNQICDVDWDVVLVSCGYLDFVFAFVVEQHLKTSTKEISLRLSADRGLLRELHSDVESIFSIALRSHFRILSAQLQIELDVCVPTHGKSIVDKNNRPAPDILAMITTLECKHRGGPFSSWL